MGVYYHGNIVGVHSHPFLKTILNPLFVLSGVWAVSKHDNYRCIKMFFNALDGRKTVQCLLESSRLVPRCPILVCSRTSVPSIWFLPLFPLGGRCGPVRGRIIFQSQVWLFSGTVAEGCISINFSARGVFLCIVGIYNKSLSACKKRVPLVNYSVVVGRSVFRNSSGRSGIDSITTRMLDIIFLVLSEHSIKTVFGWTDLTK